MYNASTIQDEFRTLGRWRKNDDPSATFNPIGDMLTGSDGMFFNDAHPLLKIETLRSVLPDYTLFTYPIWVISTTYSKGDIVKVSGVYYASVTDSNVGHAVNLSAYWRVTNPLNEELRNWTIAAATKVVDDLLALKFERLTADNLLKSDRVLNILDSKKQLSQNLLTTCNWNIVTDPRKEIILTLHRLTVHFSAAKPGMTFSLYKAAAFVKSWTFDVVAGMNVFDLEDYELEQGQEYRISYEVENTAKPYNDISDRWMNLPYFPGMMGLAQITTFTHAGSGETGWETAGRDYQGVSDNYGLDLEISARCDYTNLFVANKKILAPAFQKSVACIALRNLAFNPNAKINRDEENVQKRTLLYEIDGDSQGRDTGLGKQYRDTLKTITLDTHSLCDFCLPKKLNKIQWGVT